MFHIIWPVLTIGLSLFLVIFEILWIVRRDEDYYRLLRFWARILLLNFAIGVASGLVMEFEFGTNWQPFTYAAGGFFGNILGLEGTLAFMLEAGFLGIMMFGWRRVPRGLHLFATIMVALGSSLSAFWILVANSWMQTPSGGYFAASGAFVVTNFGKAIMNPDMPMATVHMWIAALETSAFAVGGISAWYLKRKRHVNVFLKTFRITLIVAIVTSPLQIYFGDAQGLTIKQLQPTALAAMEAHWKTNPKGVGASWNLLAWPDRKAQDNAWSIQIPDGLSIITTRSLTGQVTGLRAFPRKDQPPILIPFYGFRVMVLISFLLLFLAIWTLVAWLRGRLRAGKIVNHPRLLAAWIAAVPLGYLAVETGWLTREEARQPWIIFNVLRTQDASSNLPPAVVALSLAALGLIYALLIVLFIVFARRIIIQGPDSGAQISGPKRSPAAGETGSTAPDTSGLRPNYEQEGGD